MMRKSQIYIQENGGIAIELRGARKMLTLKRRLIIAPEQVKSLKIIKKLKKPKFWKKVSGCNGWYYGGWFRENGENEFWDVLNADFVLEISTSNFKYQKLFIEVDKGFKLEKDEIKSY